MTEVVDKISTAPLMVEVTGHGKVAVGPGQALYLTAAKNSVLTIPQKDGSLSYVLLKKDGKTGYNSPTVKDGVEKGTFALTAKHPLAEETVVTPVGQSDAMADFLALSKVKAHHKVVNGKVVYVDAYTNKVVKKLVDLTDPDGDLYKIPGIHTSNLKKAGMKDGLIRLPKGTKVYVTQTGNVVVDPPGIKAFTFKTDGDIVPTMKVMLDKAEAGKLTAVLPFKDQTITAKAETAAEAALKSAPPVSPVTSITPGFYVATNLGVETNTPELKGLQLHVKPDGSGLWMYSLLNQGVDIYVAPEKVKSFFEKKQYDFKIVSMDVGDDAVAAPVGSTITLKDDSGSYSKIAPNKWVSSATGAKVSQVFFDATMQSAITNNGATLTLPGAAPSKVDPKAGIWVKNGGVPVNGVLQKVTVKPNGDVQIYTPGKSSVTHGAGSAAAAAAYQLLDASNGWAKFEAETWTEPSGAADLPVLSKVKFAKEKQYLLKEAPNEWYIYVPSKGDSSTFSPLGSNPANDEFAQAMLDQGAVQSGPNQEWPPGSWPEEISAPTSLKVDDLPNYTVVKVGQLFATYYQKYPGQNWKLIGDSAAGLTAAPTPHVIQGFIDKGAVVTLPDGFEAEDEVLAKAKASKVSGLAEVQPWTDVVGTWKSTTYMAHVTYVVTVSPQGTVTLDQGNGKPTVFEWTTTGAAGAKNWVEFLKGATGQKDFHKVSDSTPAPNTPASAPIGTKLVSPDAEDFYLKQADNLWEHKNSFNDAASTYTDSDIQYSLDVASSSTVTPQWHLEEPSAYPEFGALPVGTVLSTADGDSGQPETWTKKSGDTWSISVNGGGSTDYSPYTPSAIYEGIIGDLLEGTWTLHIPGEAPEPPAAEGHPDLPHIGWPSSESVVYKYNEGGTSDSTYAVSYADGSWIVVSSDVSQTPQVFESDSTNAVKLNEDIQSGLLVKIGEVHDEPEVVEEKKAKKPKKSEAAVDLADGVQFASKYEVNAYIQKTIFVALKKRLAATSYYNSDGNPEWGNFTAAQKADVLTEDGVRETLAEAIASLKPVSKWPADKIEKSEKMAIGKQRARFETYLRASDFLIALKNKTLTDAEITDEMTYLESRMGYEKSGLVFGSKWPLDVQQTWGGISKTVEVYKFNAKIAPLGWTPATATSAQLTQYIKTEGQFSLADLLSESEKKVFVQHLLGDPEKEYGSASLAMLKAKAGWSAVKASLLLKAKEAAKDAIKDAPQTQNVTAVHAAAKATKNSLVSYYETVEIEGSGPFATATWVGPSLGGTDPGGDPLTYSVVDSTGETLGGLSDNQMLDAIDESVYKPHPLAKPVYGPKSPYAGHDFKAALQAVQDSSGHGALAFWSPQILNAYIKTHGGNYVGVMDADTKRKWVMWYAKGDLVATYAIENAQVAKTKAKNPKHTIAKSHTGSPDSAAGKVAIQALVDWVHTRPWAKNLGQSASAWSQDDLKEALNDLDMQPFSGVPFENLSKSGLAARMGDWLDTHPYVLTWEPSEGIQKAKASPTAGLTLPPLSKPVIYNNGNWPQEDWDAALGLENDDPDVLKDLSLDYAAMTKPQLETAIASTSLYGSGVTALALSQAPLNVQRFFLLHQSASYDAKIQYNPVFKVLAWKIKQGAYLDPTKQSYNNWVTSSGNPIWLKPGDALLQKGPNTKSYFMYLVVHADGTTTAYDEYGSAQGTAAVSVEDFFATGLHIADAPKQAVDVSKTAAESAGFSGNEYEALTTYEALDGEKVVLWDGAPSTPLDIDKALKTVASGETPFTDAAIAEMPLSVKKYAIYASMNDDAAAWNLVAWKANSGGYAKKYSLKPDASYTEKIKNGQTDNYTVGNYWTSTQQQDYAKDFDLYVPPFVSIQNVIAAHIAQMKMEDEKVDASTITAASALVFHEVPGHHGLGGMHSKSKIADQYGRYWMVKSFASDPNGPARVDSEHAANLIGRLFGFHQPETRAEQWKGKYSYIQHLAPAKSDAGLAGIGPMQLTDEQLYQAMAEHVLDWMVSNHDTHEANLLLAPNGKDVIGIDKGQAFKFFPNDKLQVGWIPPGNGAPVWFDLFYKGVQNGSIPKEKADAIVKRVLLRAKSMSTRKDEQYRALLEVAFKSRKTWPEEYPTKEKFIEGLMERKHNLLSTFETFYKGIYAQSPYTWDIDVSKLQDAKTGEGQHTAYLGTSQELVDEAVKAKVFGKAGMFNTLDLEDGHLLFYTEKAHNGATIFNASGTLLKEADAKVMKWLKSQNVENSAVVQPDVYNVVDPAAVLPNNDQWYGMILNGVKTINTHATDQEFNAEKIAQMENAKNQITAALLVNPSPAGEKLSVSGVGTFEDQDQYDAWKAMAQTYLDTIAKAESAKASGSKYKGFQQVVYSPKPKAKLDEEYTSQQVAYSLKHFADGTWKQVVTSTGEVLDVSEKWALEQIQLEKMEKSDVSAVSVGTKTLKVIKRTASGTQGKLDPTTGELIHSSSDQGDGQSGYEYDVEFGSTRITYKPWTGANVDASQQGQIRFHIKDFDGNLSSVDDALDVMRVMGVDLEPADDESLELLYWRMASAIVSDRVVTTKMQKVVDGYAAIVAARKAGTLLPTDELTQIKALWAAAIGQDKVDAAKWRPRFDRVDMWNPEDGTGHPYWLRPDLDLETVKKAYGNHMLTHSWSGGGGSLGEAMGSSGLIATDERLRILGSWIQGMSSGPDQKAGSAGFVFTRQHQSGASIYVDPVAVLRLHSYAFKTDHYGKVALRKTEAPWDPAKFLSSSWVDSNNELLVKNMAGTLDLIAVVAFGSAQDRDTAIKRLAEKGITEIRGMPVSERFVYGDASVALAKAWKATIEWEKTHGDD